MAAKVQKSIMSKVGVWSYVIGLVIAAVVGVAAIFGGDGLGPWGVTLLVVLGVIVGLLNIGDDEVQQFLLASIAFVLASSAMADIFQSMSEVAGAAGSVLIGLSVFMSAIAVFTAPGAIIVALKALYQVASDD